MKFASFTASVALMTIGLVGCKSNKTQDAHASAADPSSNVTDVAIAPAPMPSASAYDPMTVSETPTSAAPVMLASATPAGGISASSYTVKRGDTLYGIARTTYGDGKQWKKIANANPGVSATSLKVGQTLSIP